MNEQYEKSTSINAVTSKFYRLRNRVLLKKYSAIGLTVLQVTTLRAVYENNGCIQKELSSFVDTSPTVMVGVLSVLENQGLVERRFCPTNRRIINIFITDKGVEYVDRIGRIIAETEHEYMAELSDDEIEQLHKLLIKALHSWQSVYEKS